MFTMRWREVPRLLGKSARQYITNPGCLFSSSSYDLADFLLKHLALLPTNYLDCLTKKHLILGNDFRNKMSHIADLQSIRDLHCREPGE